MVLGVPTPFLYAEDDTMAESILAFGELHLDMVDLHGGAAHDERM